MTQDIALTGDYETGLEDFNPEEALLPRLEIVHADGVFKDSLTGEEFALMRGVPLGLIKQRVMWHEKQENDSKPQCKSSDAEIGFPNVTGPNHSLFPWAEFGINPQVSAVVDENGRPTLKCETCPATQWRRANGKNEPPRCSERYTIPIVFSVSEDPNAPLDHAGIISFQRSGITPMKSYISGFSRAKKPLFSAMAVITLSRQSRGTVTYSTPVIKRLGPTNESDWEEYAQIYRSLREILRLPPRFQAPEPAPEPTSNAWPTTPVQQAQPAQPVMQAQVVVQQPVVQQAQPVVVQQPVVQQPVVQQPVVQQPIVTAPIIPQQVAAPQPQPQLVGAGIIASAGMPVAVVADDDDLPF